MGKDKDGSSVPLGLSSEEERFLERLGQAVDTIPVQPIDLEKIARETEKGQESDEEEKP